MYLNDGIKTVMHRILFLLLTFITRNTSDYAAKMENMNGGMKIWEQNWDGDGKCELLHKNYTSGDMGN